METKKHRQKKTDGGHFILLREGVKHLKTAAKFQHQSRMREQQRVTNTPAMK